MHAFDCFAQAIHVRETHWKCHLQEDVKGDATAENKGALARGLQGGAQPDPRWDITWDIAEAEEEERKDKKANRKRKASQLAAGSKSFKELLDAQGVAPQTQTDSNFTGHCAHCNEKGKASVKPCVVQIRSNISIAMLCSIVHKAAYCQGCSKTAILQVLYVR